jgi:hypothetical protein
VPDLQTIDVNPLERAVEIKDLFLADNYSAFPEFFDRAYPSAVENGAKSWVGVDTNGRVATHIARFARQFTWRDKVLTGGVLLNLIAAKSHRTLLPAIALMRRMTSDSKTQRDVDFVYAIPSPAAAALLKAVGFSTLGSMDRFVFPLAGRRWYTDVPARLYQLAVRVRTTNRAKAVEHAARDVDVTAFERPPGQSTRLRPMHPPEVYRQCLPNYPSATDQWFTFYLGMAEDHPDASVLVRGGAESVAILCSFSRVPGLLVSAVVPPLAASLRRAGYKRLQITTIAGTHFARELTAAGFIKRPHGLPFMALPVTESGVDALRCIADWEITELDGDPNIY